METIVFLSKEQVITLHDEQIKLYGGRNGINREGSLCSLSCVDDGEVEVYRRLRGGKITPLMQVQELN